MLTMLVIGCQENNQLGGASMPVDIDDDLKVVADSRVFFGHQSVGNNIIEGLESLVSSSGVELAISDYQNYQEESKGCLLHNEVGENTDPVSKCTDFGRIIDEELSGKIDYALLKFCYVDVTRRSDVKQVFGDYQRTIDDLIDRHPDITFIHTTVPLMHTPSGVKVWIKKLLGRENTRKLDNIKRNEFNELLRATYSTDPIIDIAKSESTYPDGRRETFEVDGKAYYSMISEYTSDGGHLNSTGQFQVAKSFVQELAQIIRTAPAEVE